MWEKDWGEEGVGSALEGELAEPPPVLCWRMKRARRDGVLGLGWTGDSELGLPRTKKKKKKIKG